MIPTPTTIDMQTVVAMAATVRLTLAALVGATMILVTIQFIVLGYVVQRMRVVKTKQSQFVLRDMLIQQRNENSRRLNNLQVNFLRTSGCTIKGNGNFLQTMTMSVVFPP